MQASDGKLLLVDVRPSKEYRTGHIPGAVNMPHNKIDRELDRLNEAKTIVLYCFNGKRTRMAEQTLLDHGVNGLRHLPDGLIAWRKKGYPVNTGWKP